MLRTYSYPDLHGSPRGMPENHTKVLANEVNFSPLSSQLQDGTEHFTGEKFTVYISTLPGD
jgi:hypothetical protein